MAVIHGRDGDGEARALRMDGWSWQLVTIDQIHHEVHEGDTFTAGHYDDEVVDAASAEVLLRVGAEPAHAFFSGAAGGDAVAYLVENPTVNDAGTALTEYNLNRTSSNTATVAAYHTPTVAGGTVLMTQLMPGGAGPFSTGAVARSGSEWILKPNEDYVARITNISGGAQEISIGVEWYEEASH